MPAVREALERMWLDRHSACRREPRPIRELIPQQPLHTFLVHGIVDRHASRNMQGIKRQACGIGVCSNAWNLAPTSIFIDRKSTRLNSSHQIISYAVFCLK